MSTAIKSAGVPLSSIFDPYQPGTTKARASGIDDAGNDLSNLYASIAYGSAAAATGIKSQGADLNTLYAKIGTASYGLPFNGQKFIGRSSGLDGPNMDASVILSINSNGTYTITCAGNSADTGPNASGTWLPSGQSVSDYQVQFIFNQTFQYTTGPATITNGAATYQACTTTRTLSFDAQVGQNTAADKGSKGSITLNLKRISTGVVTATACTVDVESHGSG